ncbi:MAG: hypothetical protein KatS3mg061_2206 [Dehalococcoidia bacterium]|nr:MAG: hypothetical protein KatS3mg061_2206 [Dehalococcoidia bacterium]
MTSRSPKRRRLFGLGPGQLLLLLVVLGVAAGGGYYGYQRLLAPETATAARLQTQPVRRGNLVATVSSTGTVQANTTARLAFRSGGYLAEVYVRVGDSVKAGQPLAKLDTKDLEITLRQQQANLASAQARLQQTLAGALPSDIQAAVASVASAQAQFVKAQADLQKLTTPPSPDEVQQLASQLEKARVALQNAQTEYDRISWRGDAASTPQAVALQNATADYQSALAAYNLKIAPPKESDVATARQAVESARQQVEAANTRLAQLQSGPTPQDVAAAQAAVEQAAAAVATAQLNLDRAILVAPFDGVVSALTASPGEVVGSNPFLTLVDPTNLRLDVNVDENDVARLDLGQAATITLDALPGRTYRGRVIAIAPVATIQQGVASYPVSLQIEQPEGVKAGMTANVQIIVEERQNVLLVPARAVRTQGRERSVDVLLADGRVETRRVRVGVSNDQQTEILEGVREGEQVVIPSTTTRPPSGVGGGAPPFVIPR